MAGFRMLMWHAESESLYVETDEAKAREALESGQVDDVTGIRVYEKHYEAEVAKRMGEGKC